MSDVDWDLFEFESDRLFSQLECSFEADFDRVDSALDKQGAFDALNSKLLDAFNDVARPIIPKKSRRDFTVERYRELSALLRGWKRLKNRYRRVKLKLNKLELQGKSTESAQSLLSGVAGQLNSARAKFSAMSNSLLQRDWARICRAIENKPAHQAFKAWKRTVPSSNLPLNSVTLRSNSPLPASLKESLNNMADFWSAVQSSAAIPEWDHRKPVGEPRSRTHSRTSSRIDVALTAYLDSPRPRQPCELDDPISEAEVARSLHSLKGTTAPGPDELPARFLKNSPTVVHRILTRLFDASWRHGVLPAAWRQASSFCLFKKGARCDPSSYRIISITSILIRAFERIVKDRIAAFLERRQFFAVGQAGFRRGLSTFDHLYLLQRETRRALSKGKQLPVVFLDIVKAFDRVPHDRLLYKLFKYAGVSGKAWLWIRAFLTDRTFCVTQGSLRSRVVHATAGVPQGAVLSPLLFIIYINDLVSKCTLRVHQSLYADDIAAWPIPQRSLRYPSQLKELRLYLDYVSEWSREWLLDFSVSKSAVVTFCHNRRARRTKPLILLGKPLPATSSYKYLGHTIDSDGGYRSHLRSVLQKVRHTAYLIGRVTSRSSLPSPSIVCRIVRAVLLPQMTYAFSLVPVSVSVLSKMTQIAAAPLRKALGLMKHSSAARVLWEFGLYDLRTLHCKAVMDALLRARRCAKSNLTLAAYLAHDFDSYAPARVPEHCTPFPVTISRTLALLDLPAPPNDKSMLKSALDKLAVAQWQRAPISDGAKSIKPGLKSPSYLKFDHKPAVCVRARVRLSSELSFKRLHLFKKRPSAGCDFCLDPMGDIRHLLLHCPRFAHARSQCTFALHNDLRTPLPFNFDVLRGILPDDIRKSDNKRCLKITAAFLSSVSSVHFL